MLVSMDRLWNSYQEHEEVKLLVDAFSRKMFHHSYIISGARGTGKLTIACGLAVALIQAHGEVLDTATGMSRILHGGFMDVMVFRDEGQSLKIEDVREISRRVSQSTSTGYRIIIIEHIERMTVEASNGFLKTLEEPSEHTVFLMTTDSFESLLPTITSRAQTVSVLPLRPEELRTYMDQVAPERPQDVDTLAYGRPEIARILVGDEALLERYRRLSTHCRTLTQQVPMEQKVGVIEDVLKDKEDVLLFLELYSYHLRETVLECVRSGQPAPSRLRSQLEQIGNVRLQIQQNVNKRLVLEHFLLFV